VRITTTWLRLELPRRWRSLSATITASRIIMPCSLSTCFAFRVVVVVVGVVIASSSGSLY